MDDKNVDYKRMYFTLLDSLEKAIEILIAGQQKDEDIYAETYGYEENSEE